MVCWSQPQTSCISYLFAEENKSRLRIENTTLGTVLRASGMFPGYRMWEVKKRHLASRLRNVLPAALAGYRIFSLGSQLSKYAPCVHALIFHCKAAMTKVYWCVSQRLTKLLEQVAVSA